MLMNLAIEDTVSTTIQRTTTHNAVNARSPNEGEPIGSLRVEATSGVVEEFKFESQTRGRKRRKVQKTELVLDRLRRPGAHV